MYLIKGFYRKQKAKKCKHLTFLGEVTHSSFFPFLFTVEEYFPLCHQQLCWLERE